MAGGQILSPAVRRARKLDAMSRSAISRPALSFGIAVLGTVAFGTVALGIVMFGTNAFGIVVIGIGSYGIVVIGTVALGIVKFGTVASVLGIAIFSTDASEFRIVVWHWCARHCHA